MTVEQVRDGSKDVTRRFGWWFLKPAERVCAVVKGMGLKKGEKIQRIRVIEVVSTRGERLDAITQADCVREGFPDMTPAEFVEMMCKHYKVTGQKIINRIEFRYVDGVKK